MLPCGRAFWPDRFFFMHTYNPLSSAGDTPEMSISRGLIFFAVLFCTFLTPSLAKALPPGLVESLSPLDGVIVMQIDNDYLIDLDASKGLAEGDIFSVITPGKQIIHPITGKVIGSLEKVEGWLVVTRIRKGYAYVHPLDPKVRFTKGTPIHRFKDLPAIFWDYTGAGENTYNELRTALPNLEWRSYTKNQAVRPAEPGLAESESPALTFIYSRAQLQIRGLDNKLIGQFPMPAPAGAAGPPGTPSTRPTLATPPQGAAGIKSGIVTAGSSQQSPQGIIRNQTLHSDSIWSATEFNGNPAGIEIADFDQDGTNDLAILHRNSLEIGQLVGRKYQKKLLLPLPGIEKALTISSADLDGDGCPELFISAMDGYEVDSLVVAFRNGRYQVVQAHLPWFLRAIKNPDGSETVLGQRLGDRVQILDTRIEKIIFADGSYSSSGEYDHPWQANAFALQPLQGPDGKPLFAAISDNNRLRVFTPDSQEQWESSTSYGGSTISFSQEDKSSGRDSSSMHIYEQPRLLALDSATILAPQNQGWQFAKSFKPIGPGQVSALSWDGNSMVELWHTTPQQGSLADFQYADLDNDHKPEVVLLMQFKRAGIFSKGKSGLIVFEIN